MKGTPDTVARNYRREMATEITEAGQDLITKAFEELESEKRIGISLGGVIRVSYVRYSHR